MRLDRARRAIGPVAAIDAHLLALWRNGGRTHRLVAEAIGLRQRPRVHQLHEDAAAGIVHGVGDRAPGACLFDVGQAGLPGIALRIGAVGVGAFGDDQPEAAAREARVVVDHRRRGHALGRRADARHRRDDEAVGQGDAVDIEPIEQRRSCLGVHAGSPSATAMASISISASGEYRLEISTMVSAG
ncbi:hypothetical protein B551_0220860 [Cupriavidus sp. HPC(L)]|nr:hypothetical protein B551_0220860 [Cupriavidus sp. HPC(L)]